MKEGETGKTARGNEKSESRKQKKGMAGMEKMKMLKDGLRKEGWDVKSDRGEEQITEDGAKMELEQ